MTRARSIAGLATALVLCLGAGRIGSLFTTPNLAPWYRDLAKPPLTPPDLAFPIVWTALYILMAIALWRAARRTPAGAPRATVTGLFLLQLALNVAWSYVFFQQRALGAALLVLIALLGALIATLAAFRRHDPLADGLLLPYVLWVGFAGYLNAAIWYLNA